MSSPCHRPTPRTRGRTSSPSGGGRCSGSPRIRASRSRRPGARSGSCSRGPAPCAPASATACSPATRTTGSSPSGFPPRKYRSAGDGALKVLLVTRHFPPGGGGGVQRPLKFATHLPALGIETHVLAPDVSGSVPDEELELPTQAWIHRVRYVGPRAGRPSERLLDKQGVARLGTQAALVGRKLLVPDENAPWSALATPVAI